MVLRPVGDLPASVYWVRRLLLLLVALAVAALVWWLLPGGDGDTAEPVAAPSVSPTPSATTTSPSPSPKPSKTKSKEPKAQECQDSAIEVTVDADAESYPPARSPSFTFAVENVSDERCQRDVGQSANELRVTSGGSQVWSSDDCNPGGEEAVDNLKPGDRFVQTVTWPRVESSEGCPTPEPDAAPGTYQVIARNGDVLSEPAVFVLE